uniref:Uncharacterized protein n=1 Tax=viral metagenome TaxID=1070528 RepID=A0A6H1ZEP8_9ZZZZ
MRAIGIDISKWDVSFDPDKGNKPDRFYYSARGSDGDDTGVLKVSVHGIRDFHIILENAKRPAPYEPVFLWQGVVKE